MSGLSSTDQKCKSKETMQSNVQLIAEKPDPSIAHELYKDATQKEAMSVKKRCRGVKHDKKRKMKRKQKERLSKKIRSV